MKCADDTCMYNKDEECTCKAELSMDCDHECNEYEEKEDEDDE